MFIHKGESETYKSPMLSQNLFDSYQTYLFFPYVMTDLSMQPGSCFLPLL